MTSVVDREKLFQDNKRLVYSVLHGKRYTKRNCDMEDLAQEGLIALWKAAKDFDPSKGVKFSTYAIKRIQNRLLNVCSNPTVENQMDTHTSCSLDMSTPNGDESRTLGDMLVSKESVEGEVLQKELVRNIISTLDERSRFVFVRIFREAHTGAEVAKELNLSQATISRSVSKIRRACLSLIKQ